MRKGLFLKELYVARDARHAGVGRALMAAVASVAVAEGFNRVDWTASAADGRLMDFYEALGAVRDPKRCFFRLAGDALSGLAGT
ncbi:GNAT family N-acetyltransferase [Salmonella enterica]|nr:GNAT family N-acetyltransferase [Salmonella enterica]